METMKASRRKQTKPNRNPFGMEPQTGSFNSTFLPSSRFPLPAEEELPYDNRALQKEQEMPLDNREYGQEMAYDGRDFERQIYRDKTFEGDRENGAGGAFEREENVAHDMRDFEGDREMLRDTRGMEDERAVEDGDVPLDMSIVSCRMCPETFATSADPHNHVDMDQGPTPKKSRMDFEFPTAYHRLGSELLQENLPSSDQPQEQEQALSLTVRKSESECRDGDLARDQSGEGRSVKVNGGRIFHMDAYCELCDREFCNKYFLKTHKAIKHGISEDSSPSTPLAPDVSQKSPGGNLPPPPPRVDLPPSPWQQQQESKKDKLENKQPSPSFKKSEADLAAEEKVSSVITAVKNSLQNSQSDSKSSSSNSGSGGTTKDPSMEDYCEFCQKHFCNKYYLKKHKQDVHGIIPETGPTTTKRSRASSSMLDLPMPPSSLGSPMLLPQPMASLGGMPSLPPGVMVLNPFMPQMLIPTGNMPPPLIHGPQLHPPPHSPVLSQSLSLPGAVPGLSPPTPSSQMCELSPNPETYCSLCSKEFSNVYFLKIHKANRHGIHSDEIPPEAKMLGDVVESNGVLVHPRPSSMDGKLEGNSKSSPPPLTSVSQMVTCRLCDKDFPNVQAFRIHQVNEHGKNLEPSLPDSFESSLPKAEPPVSSSESFRRMSADLPPAHVGSSNGPGGTMFGNMVTARLGDRVVCDICNKDLCNKYFLKSHKLKMHGIDIDKEEGNELGKDKNSSYDRYSPCDPGSRAQPLNMTMSPKQGLPPLVMPKLESRDFSNGSNDFKMEKHGGLKNFSDIPSFLSETINNEYLRRSTPQPPFKGFDYGIHGFPPAPSANMSHDQLLGEGIDPEAYCDICKKEFCSKYFLKTHKENIHGIKTEVTTPNRPRAKPGPKPSLPKLNSMSGNSSSNLLASLPMPSMPFPFPTGLMMRGNGGGGSTSFNRARESFEKHHFRWKDPPTTNATARVTCDICNKELCNKYFLRTHKLKKHGIAPTDTTQSPMNDSSAPTENDTSSSHSVQPDNFLVDKGTGMTHRPEGTSVPHSIPLPPTERHPKLSEPVKFSRSEEEKAFPGKPSNSSDNNNTDTVTCHLCERKFRNMQWLSAHLIKDHAEASTPDLMDLRMLPPPLGHFPPFGGDIEPKICRVCRILVPNELSLKLHLLQEHNAQIKLEMDEAPARSEEGADASFFSRGNRRKSLKSWRSRARKHTERKLKMFVCSFGDYRTHWLYKLQLHEKTAHGISMNRNRSTKPPEDREKYEDMNPFKCGLCTSRFRSHAYCQVHVREAHIHALKDFVARKRRRAALQKLSCRYCSFTTSFPFRLRSHVSATTIPTRGPRVSLTSPQSRVQKRPLNPCTVLPTTRRWKTPLSRGHRLPPPGT